MNGRALIIGITGAILLAGSVSIWFAQRSHHASRPPADAYAIAESRNISETVAAMGIRRIRANSNVRGDLFETPLPLFGGRATVRVEDTLAHGKHVIRLEAVGRVENHFDTTFAYVEGDSVWYDPLP
jgi:hypothetical protein